MAQAATATATGSKEVKTACGMRYTGCGVKVQLQGGLVVGIEGNPDHPQSRGMMLRRRQSWRDEPQEPDELQEPEPGECPLDVDEPEKGIYALDLEETKTR
jgi:anaerobic selenocysteine-containing dehydrogenase